MFPSIILQQVRKYSPRSEATVNVHIRAIQNGLRYTQISSSSIINTTSTSAPLATIIENNDTDFDRIPTPKPSTTPLGTPSPMSSPTLLPTTTPNDKVLADDMVEQLIKPSKSTNYFYYYCKPITGKIYTDQSGPILIPSATCMTYEMFLYNFYINLIWYTNIPSKTKTQLFTDYKRLFLLMK